MFLALLIGLLTLLIVGDYLRKRRHNEIFKKNGINSMPSLPIIGVAHHLIKKTPADMIEFTGEVLKNIGKTCNLWLLNQSTILTADPVFLEPLLSSQKVLTKNNLYGLLSPWLREGLLLSTGSKWHSRRKIITPTFHFKILEEFVGVFERQSNVMMDLLREKADGKTVVNLYSFVCAMALDVIAETAMGVKIHAQLQPDLPYVKAVRTVSAITSARFVSMLQRFDFWLWLTANSTYKQLHSSIALMHDFTGKVIEERRKLLEQNIKNPQATQTKIPEDQQDDDDEDVGRKKHTAFLDMLLLAETNGQPLTNNDIREEVDTFMFEGHDTTTSGISFTCYLLSRHPNVQQKVFEEIRAVIGDDKQRPITLRDLQELKYLECVIKESMRLYPPVPSIGRYIEQDIYLDGKLYPANTNVTVMIYHALRDPAYFKDPEKFIPERFYSDNIEKINTFAYVPFSAGPRNCVGQKFALLEMKSTISKILRHYELLPLGEDVRPLMNLVLVSSNGVNMGLKSRLYHN
ncbi:probable cytochrome P450 4d14 [Bactrocera neohumeralis]|uniref:probable cytochrome P450 4d14 n=1 Tax=Bactrocera neohumeralis TaxID=98809 RepID=UPI0021654DB9|nr:probable cytochrome P450 4d14 [Bactrocera neohumeralis]